MRARVTARYRHVLVDELEDANFAQGLLVRLLAGESGQVTAAGDDDQAIHRLHGAAAKNLRDFEAEWPGVTVVRLEDSLRRERPRAPDLDDDVEELRAASERLELVRYGPPRRPGDRA